MTSTPKPIAYTIGEPAGIGADIILQLANATSLPDIAVIGDRNHLASRAAQLGLSIPKALQVRHTPISDSAVCGQPAMSNVDGVITMLDTAIDGCLEKEYSAMVTGPLHKGVINDAGISFSGHTEYLAERTGVRLPVMMLATPHLRVALVTTHLPLKEVSSAITRARVVDVCEIVDRDLKSKFGVAKPRILVCGLNRTPARVVIWAGKRLTLSNPHCSSCVTVDLMWSALCRPTLCLRQNTLMELTWRSRCITIRVCRF